MDNEAVIAAVSDMDNDSALDFILSQNIAEKRQSVKAVKVAKNKMEDCSVCPDASRQHCFDCMNDFYNHMHDPTTMGRLFMPQQRELA